MSERPRSASRARIVTCRWAGVAALVLVLASCGAVRPARTPQPGPSTSSRPSPHVQAAATTATAAYLGMWQAMARAAQTSDWASPELDEYATGLARASIIRSLYADHFRGVVTRGSPTNAPVVRSVEPAQDPTRVMIEDCGDSTHALKYHQGTDIPAGDGPGGGRRAIIAEVLREPDRTWRVNRFAVRGLGTC